MKYTNTLLSVDNLYSFTEKPETEISWSSSMIFLLLALACVIGTVDCLRSQCIPSSPVCWISRPDYITPEKSYQKLLWLISLTRRKKLVHHKRCVFCKWCVNLYLQQHNVVFPATGTVGWVANLFCNLKILLFALSCWQWMNSKSNFGSVPEKRQRG